MVSPALKWCIRVAGLGEPHAGGDGQDERDAREGAPGDGSGGREPGAAEQSFSIVFTCFHPTGIV